MIGIESIIKLAPVIGGVLFVTLSYGKLQADVNNLQNQVASMQVQIEKVSDKIDRIR